MGWMVSIVGLVGLILGAVAGMVVGPLGPKRVLVAALLLAAAASAAQTLLPPYPVMMGLRVAEGLSHLAIVVVGPVLMARASTPAMLGFVMALWGSFFGLSFAGLAIIVPRIVAEGGLGAVFLAHAIWMAVCGAVLAVLLPADPPAQPLPRGDWLGRHLRIYASPRLAAPALGFVCYTILFVALLTLLPPQVAQGARATVTFWMPLAAIIVSLTIGVWVLRHLSAVHTVQIGFALAALAAVGLFAVWEQAWPMAGMALALSGAFGLVQGASFAAIAQLNEAPEDRAMAAGAVAQMGNLGTVTGTPLMAWAFSTGEAGALLAMALPFCLAGIAIHSVQARRRMRQ